MKSEKETINELCKTLSCYQADIKRKDREIEGLNEECKRHHNIIDKQQKKIAELKAKLEEWRNAAPYHITERIKSKQEFK